MESDDDVSLFYTQSLIAECKNEDFGEPDTTTLFPLDPDTLDNICRVNIPGVPLTKYGVDPGYSRHGFNQCLSLHTGADLNSLEVNITQCCSHYNALRAMDEFIDDRGSDSVYALKCEGLGNHAVEIECTDSSVYERCTVAIWVRWTTAIEIRSSGKREEDPENPLVDIKRLASALDTAMKEHKGTISQVPKVTVGLEQSEIPLFREEGQIEHIQMTFQPETHPRKPFHVEEAHSSGAKFEIGCDPIYSRTAPRSREHLIWKPYGGECSFPDYGIFLRCKKLGHATLRIKIVHKSSLWPTIETFNLH